MKKVLKVVVLGGCSAALLLIDAPVQVPYPTLQFVPEAHAILGVRRRTAVATAVVVESADSAKMAQANQQAAAAQQQAAIAQQQAAAAKQQAAAAQQQAAPVAVSPPGAAPQAAAAAAPTPRAAAGAPLALGTVVPALPAGCVPTPVGGIEYYYCAGNFYRAVFQGTQLVYVTAKP